MSVKTRDKLWAISLMLIGICTLLLIIPNFVGVELPLILVRILGGIELAALPVLAFTTIRKLIDKKETEN